MNDLELCKKIAELESVDVVEDGGGLRTYIKVGVTCVKTLCENYNPLTNKALLYDLVFKYEIDLSFSDGLVLVKRKNIGWGVTAMKVSKADAPRAILECIIKANELR